jgi:hypothetical protein
LFIGLGLVLAACASPSVSSEESTGGEPSATPTEESEAPTESPAASESEGGDGGSPGAAPALADGPWTSGHAQITVGGGVSLTIDQDLTTDLSDTTDAKTQLAYNTDAEFVTIGINFIGVPFHADVTGDDSSASSEDCEVTYERADDTGIDATFSCVADEFYWFSADPEPSDPVTIEGTVTATR